MTSITNDGATEDSKSRYNICMRSGKKVKPGELVVEPVTNLLVLPEYLDPYPTQLRVRDKAELLTGSIRPEGADIEVGTVSPEDL